MSSIRHHKKTIILKESKKHNKQEDGQGDCMDDITLGDRIRSSRKEARLSQDALAKKVGLTKSGISSIERGETKSPVPANLLKIAYALHCNLEWLITGNGDKSQPNSGEKDTVDVISLRIIESLSQLPDAKRYELIELIDKVVLLEKMKTDILQQDS